MTIRVAAVVACVMLSGGCTADPDPPASTDRPAERRAPGDWFADAAAESGLEFVHVNGASGEFYYPEILGPGVGFLDFDNDGDLDVYLVQGGMLGRDQAPRDALGPVQKGMAPTGRLFRNDLQRGADGTPALRFTDVTEASGLRAANYGLGVATGDVDNDGAVDVLLTNFGSNQLFRNNGNGTFTDLSDRSGLQDDSRFAVSAAFVDYDRDGWLDVYVANNVNYTIANETKCPNPAGRRDYCPPQIYGGRPDRLYRNQRNGRFVDVSAKALVGGKFGPALGVATADYDGDGWMDIYVANDGEDNLLWMNQRDGTFRDMALLAGAAVTAEGKAEASMGVDAGDFDNDGDEDLIVTELTGEGSNLYVNDGAGRFRDQSAASGLGSLSLPYTGWGTAWFDFDNDGWLDTMAVNGTIVAHEGRAAAPFPYDQRKVLLRNLGNGRFDDVSSQAGAAFALSESGRGAAFGDVDNDGDVDVLVGNAAGRVRLLINHVGNRNHWLGLRLIGDANVQGRDMLGARVTVIKRDGSKLTRRARADGSYGSANDPRVLVGLGMATEVAAVEVRWPNGRIETWREVPIDRWTTLREGEGR